MKKLIFIGVLLFGFQSVLAQKGDTTAAALTKQGYAVGCNLGKAYANGDETSKRVYESTISAAHYPQAYRNGVLDGFNGCYDQEYHKRSYGGLNELTGYKSGNRKSKRKSN